MKRALLILVIYFIAFPQVVKGQSYKIRADMANITTLPGERVFVHYNTSLLFAGEYLYFKVYTLNTDTGNFSGLSKVAYLELVGEDGTAVLKQKVLLEKGKGQGDLFIPTSVPSGNYKLIAFTQWMANEIDTVFFRGDVVLVNPYQGDQKGLSSTNTSSPPSFTEDLREEKGDLQSVSDKNIKIRLENKFFGTREKVSATIRNINQSPLQGNLSVSVRKKESDINFSRPSTLEITRNLSNPGRNNFPTEIFLPELRGDLLVGRLMGADDNLSVAGKTVAIYVPGEHHIFKTTQTNEDGIFFVNLDEEYSDDRVLLQVVGETADYEINLFQDPEIEHSALNFTSFSLSPQMEKSIIERSIYNQIENAYYAVKPDTIKEIPPKTKFYGESGILYNLDEFTRFPSIRETFVEIITSVRIANTRTGEPQFRLRPPEGTPESDLGPLLVVDGMLLQDHKLLIDYPSQRVKSIRIIREKYFNGPIVYQGVIAVETEEGNFHEQRPSSLVKEFDLIKPQSVKKYFRQTYNQGNKENRIPDYRYQLAWLPGLNFNRGESEFWFYTSDIPGIYEISIEGFLNDGTPVSLKEYFTVE